METVVYLISNAEIINNQSLLLEDEEDIKVRKEKMILSVEGEHSASVLSKKEELQNINALYSSSYVRALSTAKYIALENDIPIHVEEALNDRVVGELGLLDGIDFFRRQEHDFDFKLHKGESFNEVKKRMTRLLKSILKSHENERIAIISHNVSIMALLSAWCEKGYNLDDRLILHFKEETLIDGSMDYLSVFALTFEGENIRGIQKLEF